MKNKDKKKKKMMTKMRKKRKRKWMKKDILPAGETSSLQNMVIAPPIPQRAHADCGR